MSNCLLSLSASEVDKSHFVEEIKLKIGNLYHWLQKGNASWAGETVEAFARQTQ